MARVWECKRQSEDESEVITQELEPDDFDI